MRSKRPWDNEGEKFQSFLNTNRLQFNRCLEPTWRCERRAIRAHSVQNAHVLEMLQRDGHVVAIDIQMNLGQAPQARFVRKGRNRATTFTGLCSQHDGQIFLPIEKEALDLSSAEHRFLLAYRAATRELHSTMEAAVRVQTGYLELVDRGQVPSEDASPAGILATTQVIKAYETFQYRSPLDEALLAGDFSSSLKHDVQVLSVERPTLAVSSLFSIDELRVDGVIPLVHLNVLPITRDQTALVLSYVPQFASPARSYLRRLLHSSGRAQLRELSRIVLTHCENFVLSPDYFETWTADKRATVLDYWTASMWPSRNAARDSTYLYLF